MSAAHTPGPWAAREWSRHARTTVVVDDPTAGVTGVRVIAECETEADARLIAAAPAMLKALRRAAIALAFAAESSPAMRDDYEAVSAAIARATGSQP